MKTRLITPIALALAGLLASANAAIITVNTTNNTDFSAGVTNLWLAIQMANTNGESANTINFNISGAGPHYLITPALYVQGGTTLALGGGYPIITNHGLTIDGYSQPGALANTNTILGSNTAALKIVIDSRKANYTSSPEHPLPLGGETMHYALITGKTYGNTTDGFASFADTDAAQIGIFAATNITIKGLCFLNDWFPGAEGFNLYSIALAADYPMSPVPQDLYLHFYPDYNLHVAGCWFNLMPDGTTVVEGGNNAVAVRRHKSTSSNNSWTTGRWSPSQITVGVAKDSANPRAEFNIIMSQAQSIACQGERGRFSGNFFNVFPDGMTQYFPEPQKYPGSPTGTTVPTEAFIGQNYGGYTVIGTDGDGVNDAEERNVMAGLPRKRANGCAQVNHQCGCYGLKIAGNYIGLAVDGVTRWTNSCTAFRLSNRPETPTNCIVGSDFDGVSDALEANVIANNWPLDYWFEYPAIEPDLGLYYAHQLAPIYQAGAPPETLNDDAIYGEISISFRGNKLINNFTAPMSPFASSRDRSNEPWYSVYYSNVVSFTEFSVPNGTAEEMATNFVTVLDPASTTRRLKGTFPLGLGPYTNVVIDVYVANEEGLTNGAKFLTLTNVLPVWSQGESVLAYNLLADTATDLDSAPGAFNFNIAPYNIPAGTKVTVMASYAREGKVGTYMAETHTTRSSLPVELVAVAEPIVITSIVSNGDGTGTINWTGGDAPYIVEECTNLTSNVWAPIATTTSPTITGPNLRPAAFYRIQ